MSTKVWVGRKSPDPFQVAYYRILILIFKTTIYDDVNDPYREGDLSFINNFNSPFPFARSSSLFRIEIVLAKIPGITGLWRFLGTH